jgi:hypothetical protein
MNTVFMGLKLIQRDIEKYLLKEGNGVQGIIMNVEDTKIAAEAALNVLNDMLLYDKITQGNKFIISIYL